MTGYQRCPTIGEPLAHVEGSIYRAIRPSVRSQLHTMTTKYIKKHLTHILLDTGVEHLTQDERNMEHWARVEVEQLAQVERNMER